MKAGGHISSARAATELQKGRQCISLVVAGKWRDVVESSRSAISGGNGLAVAQGARLGYESERCFCRTGSRITNEAHHWMRNEPISDWYTPSKGGTRTC
jgi:hypothetical protein